MDSTEVVQREADTFRSQGSHFGNGVLHINIGIYLGRFLGPNGDSDLIELEWDSAETVLD